MVRNAVLMLIEVENVVESMGEGIRTSPQPYIDCRNRSGEEKGGAASCLVVGHLAGQTAAPPLETPANAVLLTLNRACR
jgi:hypothetical protein